MLSATELQVEIIEGATSETNKQLPGELHSFWSTTSVELRNWGQLMV